MKEISDYHSGRIGYRHALLLISFLGTLFMYSTRANLSVSMVAMVYPAGSTSNISISGPNVSYPDACPELIPDRPSGHSALAKNTSVRIQRIYEWDSSTQGLLHSAFYYGYLLPQVFGGWISHRIGAKYPIALSVGSIGILTVLSPFAADLGAWCFFVVRLLIGIGQGIVFPSLTVLWSTWAPPLERGRLLATTYSGAQLGVVFGISLSGVLAEAWGWESIYYFYGSICCVWTIFWLLLAFDTPDMHPKISHAEKTYIRNALNPAEISAIEEKEYVEDDIDKTNIPWSNIFRTVPFIALLVVEFGHNWAFYTLLTNLPTYLSNILHFSLKSNGLLSALPYALRFTITIITLFISDFIQTHNYCSTTSLRKFFSLGAFLGCGGALVGVAFSGCNSTLTLVLFTFGVGISGWVFAGYIINYTEMSPRYAGITIGIGNTIGTTTGIIAPLLVGLLTNGPGGHSIENWRIVFLISASLYLVVSVVYGILGSADKQPWDRLRKLPQTEILLMEKNSYR